MAKKDEIYTPPKISSEEDQNSNWADLLLVILLLLARLILMVSEIILGTFDAGQHALLQEIIPKVKSVFDLAVLMIVVLKIFQFKALYSKKSALQATMAEIVLWVFNIAFWVYDAAQPMWNTLTKIFRWGRNTLLWKALKLLWNSIVQYKLIYLALLLALFGLIGWLAKKQLEKASVKPNLLQKLILTIDLLYFAGRVYFALSDYFQAYIPEPFLLLLKLWENIPERISEIWCFFNLLILLFYSVTLLKRPALSFLRLVRVLGNWLNSKEPPSPKESNASPSNTAPSQTDQQGSAKGIVFLIIFFSILVLALVPDKGYASLQSDWTAFKGWLVKVYPKLSLVLNWPTVFLAVFLIVALIVIAILGFQIIQFVAKKSLKETFAAPKTLICKSCKRLKKYIVGEDTDKPFGNFFTIFYLLVALIIFIGGARGTYVLIRSFVENKNLSNTLGNLATTDIFLKSIFTVLIAIICVFLSLVIILGVLKFFYSCVAERNPSKATAEQKASKTVKVSLGFSFAGAVVFSYLLLLLYFKGLLPMIEEFEEWIQVILEFGSIVSGIVVFMAVCITNYILFYTTATIIQKKGGFNEPQSKAEKYLQDIVSSMIEAALGFFLILLTFFGDYISNLYITAFDTLDDEKYHEMEENHELLDEDVAEIMYTGYKEPDLYTQLEDLKVNEKKNLSHGSGSKN